MPKINKTYPYALYVEEVVEDDTRYFLAHEDPDEAVETGETKKLYKYTRQGTVTLTNTTKIEAD